MTDHQARRRVEPRRPELMEQRVPLHGGQLEVDALQAERLQVLQRVDGIRRSPAPRSGRAA